MKLRTALPSGLTNKMCERFDPTRMGGAPPIRFVPLSTSASQKKEDGEEQASVKITISADITKRYFIFKEGETEEVVELIRTHEGLIADKKLRERHAVTIGKQQKDKARYTTLTQQDSRSAEEKEEVQILKDLLEEYNTQLKEVQAEAFDYFKKLLDKSLVETWRQIVVEECETAEFINLKGVKNVSGNARGKNFASLLPCYFRVMLWVCTQDAAERLKRYMLTTVRLADGVDVVQLFSRMDAMNRAIPYLPCLKHMKDAPADMPTMNQKFSELEMCTNVISTLPLKMSTVYYSSKGQHFPQDIKKLEEDLILVEGQVKRQDKIINELRAKVGLTGNKESDGKKKKAVKLDDPIPKKNRKGNPKSLIRDGDRPNSKLCQLCAKHSPAVKNTHNTAQCRKWNADGSEQRRSYSGKYKNANVHSHASDGVMEMVAQMSKEMKSLRKEVKSAKKKSSKKRKYESSDDSSDSDSD